MDKKRSFIFYPMSFLAAVHNLRKSQIADFIIALCEINLYGSTKISISDAEINARMKFLQTDIDANNETYYKLKETRQNSGSKGGRKTQANRKQTSSKTTESCLKQNQANASDNVNVYVNEKENEKFIDKFLVGESRNVNNSGQGVTICQENSGHYGPVSLGDVSRKLLSKIDGGV